MKCPMNIKVAARLNELYVKYQNWRDHKLNRVPSRHISQIKNEVYSSNPKMSFDSQNALAIKLYGKNISKLTGNEKQTVFNRSLIDSGAKSESSRRISKILMDRLGTDNVKERRGYLYKK